MCRRHARLRPEQQQQQQQQQEQSEEQQQRNVTGVSVTHHKSHEEDEQQMRMILTEQIQQSSRHIQELLWLGLCQNVAPTASNHYYYSYNPNF